MIVCYHAFHIQTGTIAGAATLTVLNKGKLRGLRFSTAIAGGAGAGYVNNSAELNNSAQANADTNNPPRLTVLATFQEGATTSIVQTNSSGFIPMNRDLAVGDTLSVSQVQTGNAPNTHRVNVDFYVEE